MNFVIISTPIGNLKITEESGKIIGIRETDLPRTVDSVQGIYENAVIDEAVTQLLEYFEGRRTQFTFPIEFKGSAFQRLVWSACMKIEFGYLSNYADIAASINKVTAMRAVGSALGKNPLLLVIPCHRVISRNGIGGFRLGIQIKKKLLLNEGHSKQLLDSLFCRKR